MKHIQDFLKIEENWVKLNEIGWNWVKLRVAIFAIFLTFVISCNFRQFWPIFVAVSGDLIGHFLYTSNFSWNFGWIAGNPRHLLEGSVYFAEIILFERVELRVCKHWMENKKVGWLSAKRPPAPRRISRLKHARWALPIPRLGMQLASRRVR